MFFRLLLESFRRQRRRKLLAGLAILLGTTAITAMLALATTIGDRIHNELATYGANIVITPQAQSLAVKIGGVDIAPATGNAFLHESDLNKLRTIFWANNITAISPELPLNVTLLPASNLGDGAPPSSIRITAIGLWFHHPLSASNPVILSAAKNPAEARAGAAARTLQPQSPEAPPPGGALVTGAPALHPSWRLIGRWPSDTSPGEALLGKTLAEKLHLAPGATLSVTAPDPPQDTIANQQRTAERHLSQQFTITGIISTGDAADSDLLLPLAAAQALASLPDAVSRVEVSARTRPEDAFARRDPDTLSPRDRDTWYCRPYANSIVFQIREAIPGAVAEQVRVVEQSEGNVLKRISGLMTLIALAALLAAAFAVSAAMATAVLERRAEIGLMRSLGASRASIALLFYVEAAILALIAGLLGYLAGSYLAAFLGARIFAGAPALPALNPVLLPIAIGLACLIAILGSTPAIRAALQLDPSSILRADA